MGSRKVSACGSLCALIMFLSACGAPGKKVESEASEGGPGVTDFVSLYQGNCAGCHGDYGRKGPARILNDALYLSILPKQTLKNILVYGRPGTQMPPWAESQGGPLTDKQIDILVDGMYSNWGKGMTAPANAPAYVSSAVGDPTHGKKLFMRGCFMCHAKGMNPGPITTPEYLQLASNQMLRTSIIVGRSDLGMPSYKSLNMGKPLADQDVTDLVAYLNSFRTLPAPGEMNERAGEISSATGPHENESSDGKTGVVTKGNEGSGTGPGSPTQREGEPSKIHGSSSQRGVK